MHYLAILTVTFAALFGIPARPVYAQAVDETGELTRARMRTEVSLGAQSWPGVAELDPLAAGRFDEAGFNFGAAVHWPLPRFHERGLMLGVDFVLFPNESNIAFRSEDLMLRGLYLTPSLRWYPNAKRRWSLDAGVGLYLVDIAEVDSDYGLYVETELWEATAAGGYIGTTWNFGAAGDDGNGGLFVSFKIHFFDLGSVRDEDPSLPATLGDNAGSLSRGIYQLQLGYRWQ